MLVTLNGFFRRRQGHLQQAGHTTNLANHVTLPRDRCSSGRGRADVCPRLLILAFPVALLVACLINRRECKKDVPTRTDARRVPDASCTRHTHLAPLCHAINRQITLTTSGRGEW